MKVYVLIHQRYHEDSTVVGVYKKEEDASKESSERDKKVDHIFEGYLVQEEEIIE